VVRIAERQAPVHGVGRVRPIGDLRRLHPWSYRLGGHGGGGHRSTLDPAAYLR